MGKERTKVNPERQRRRYNREFKLEAVRLLEREGEVAHLIAKRLVDHSQLLGALQTESRDFH